MNKNLATAVLTLILPFGLAYGATASCINMKPDKKRLECFDREAAVEVQMQERRQNEKLDTAKASIRAARQESLKALRRLANATDVGVSKVEYGKLVVESSFAIDEALRSIPGGPFKNKVLESKAAFLDANEVWSSQFNGRYVSTFREMNLAHFSKYAIDSSDLINAPERAHAIDVPIAKYISPIFLAAKDALAEAEKLSESNDL